MLGLLASCFLLIVTAYAEEQRFYRGNTHAHSLWSDGNDFPENVIDYYHRNGYDFAVVSDHNTLSRGYRWMSVQEITARQVGRGRGAIAKAETRFGPDWIKWKEENGERGVVLKTLESFRHLFEKPGEFLIIEAQEISDRSKAGPVHINALNLDQLIPFQNEPKDSTVEVMRRLLRSVAEQEKAIGRPILTHLNHPNYLWVVTAEDLAEVVEEQFFEVYNGHPLINHLGDENRPGDEMIWDIANTLRISKMDAEPLFGVATDDSHWYHGGEVSPGRGWIQVKAPELTADALIHTMRDGDFYASSGVELKWINYDAKRRIYEFEIIADGDAKFISKLIGTRANYDQPDTPRAKGIGEVFARSTNRKVRFVVPPDALYARVVIASDAPHPNPSYDYQKKQAWLQPVAWR
ncbi:MAG: hypothetical protein SynsKO_01130 [Synoicihabitans sp.]